MRNSSATNLLAPLVQGFLVDRLKQQEGVSVHTRASYADTLRLLLEFASNQVNRPPSKLKLEHVTPKLVLRFLEHLESKRGNTPVTRNARLSAIKSFMRYVEFRLPSALDHVRRVRAIPRKRTDTRLVSFLTTREWRALVDTTDPRSLLGTRNRALLLLAITGGLRASELVGLKVEDLQMHDEPSVHVHGKGRRQRVIPLWTETRKALSVWLRARPTTPVCQLFVSASGRPLSRAALTALVRKHATRATATCQSLGKKRVSPHVLRHTCGMIVFQATRDIRKVALWLGHSSLRTTEVYLRSDPSEKLEIAEPVLPKSLRRGRFRSPDKLIALLKQQTLC